MDQQSYRKENFGRLGGTIWELGEYADVVPDMFVPASALGEMRRNAIDALEMCRAVNRKVDYRRAEDAEVVKDVLKQIGTITNVANSLSQRLLEEYDCRNFVQALETCGKSLENGDVVMECRYCLRRELDACLLTHNSRTVPSPLFLYQGYRPVYRLDFDCGRCRMRVIKCTKHLDPHG